MVIVAGPNGAGKSTVADFLISNRSIENYINADVIAKGMAVVSTRTSDIVAGRVLLDQIESSLSRKQSLAFESTMSGASWRRLLERARELGYESTICYVAVNSVDLALTRIRQRVIEGGHDIPVATVRRRYSRSLRMFFDAYADLCDNWYFFDNSGKSASLLAVKELGHKEQVLSPELFNAYKAMI